MGLGRFPHHSLYYHILLKKALCSVSYNNSGPHFRGAEFNVKLLWEKEIIKFVKK